MRKEKAMNIDFSIQLYSVRDRTEQDFVGTLKQLADMGYKGVEFAGFGDLSAKDMRGFLDSLGLKAISSHIGYEELQGDNLKRQIEYHNTIGAEYMVCPWYKTDSMEDVKVLSELLNTAGQACKSAGITLGYHNHGHEFNKHDEIYYLDHITDNTQSDLVKLELDVYWAEHAGVDCFDYLKKHSDRIELLHLKQIGPDKKNVDLPDGSIDMKRLIEQGIKFGVKQFIVEQEEYKHSSMESARVNIEYLLKL